MTWFITGSIKTEMSYFRLCFVCLGLGAWVWLQMIGVLVAVYNGETGQAR